MPTGRSRSLRAQLAARRKALRSNNEGGGTPALLEPPAKKHRAVRRRRRAAEATGPETTGTPTHLDEGPFRFAHHPEPAPGRYVWAGHLHPTVRLSGGGDRLRLPCFHVGRGVGVLPAFSAFTGGHDVSRRPGERVFAIADPAVVEV
nr:hypothetical protein [Myxococcus sp. RHSTA-1-4]